jgi:hypothetical protein
LRGVEGPRNRVYIPPQIEGMFYRYQGATLLGRFDHHDRTTQCGQNPIPPRKVMRPSRFSGEKLRKEKSLTCNPLAEATMGGRLDQIDA